MTEQEKMLQGELYDATDLDLVLARRRARHLTKALNESRDDEQEHREQIITELFGSIGDGIWIEPPFYCDYGTNIHLGSAVFFNFNCIILDPARVDIGDNVLVGPAVQIYTATHTMDHETRRAGLELARSVRIGSDVWIGGGAIINPGVTIGSRTVIGSGSVVTREIPADVFAAGNPCRVIRKLEAPPLS
jgi:maltose O-acetyltransferase